jgi:hypothetical protein
MKVRKFLSCLTLIVLGLVLTGVNVKSAADNIDNKEKIALTGSIAFNNKVFPELTVNGKIYYLIVQRCIVRKVDIAEGETINVQGRHIDPSVKCYSCSKIDKDSVIIVEKLTIKGKDYNVPDNCINCGCKMRNGMQCEKNRNGAQCEKEYNATQCEKDQNGAQCEKEKGYRHSCED